MEMMKHNIFHTRVRCICMQFKVPKGLKAFRHNSLPHAILLFTKQTNFDKRKKCFLLFFSSPAFRESPCVVSMTVSPAILGWQQTGNARGKGLYPYSGSTLCVPLMEASWAMFNALRCISALCPSDISLPPLSP